jgi:hypothetical protein
LTVAGFSDPMNDPTSEDLKLWTFMDTKPQTKLDLQMARFILAQVADQFCDLYIQENSAKEVHISEGGYIETITNIFKSINMKKKLFQFSFRRYCRVEKSGSRSTRNVWRMPNNFIQLSFLWVLTNTSAEKFVGFHTDGVTKINSHVL